MSMPTMAKLQVVFDGTKHFANNCLYLFAFACITSCSQDKHNAKEHRKIKTQQMYHSRVDYRVLLRMGNVRVAQIFNIGIADVLWNRFERWWC